MKVRTAEDRRTRKAGFTLIEILLVVVIIGILAAIVAPKLVGRSKEAKVSAAQADLKNLSTALKMYYMDNDTFPMSDQGLMALIEKPSGSPEPKKWQKYLDRNTLPKDPWGNEYVYESEGEEYTLFSTGRDGQPDTEDDVQRP